MLPRAFTRRYSAYHAYVLAASVLIFLIGMGAMFQLAVALKPMAAAFDWPRSVPSLAFSLQFLGSGIGGILMGYWTDRSGAARPVLVGAVMMGLGAILTSYVSNEWELFLIYGVMLGLFGQSTLFTPLMTNVMQWFRDNRGMALGIVSSGQSVAGVLWPPVFNYLNGLWGWRETFFWYGIFALCTMLPLSLVFRRRPPLPDFEGPAIPLAESSAPQRRQTPPPVLGRLTSRQLQASLCAAIVGCCVAMSLPLGHIVAHTNDLGHSLARGAEMLSLILAGSLLSRVFGGAFIVDKFGGLKSLLIFSAFQAAGLGLYAMVDGLGGLYLTSFLFGFGYGGINMCYPAIIREYLPAAEVGRRMGLTTLFGAIGMAIGGTLGGYAFDLTGGYAIAFFIGFAFNIGNLAIVVGLLNWSRGAGELRSAVA